MTTAFGPQGPDYTTTRPATDTQQTTVDTWCKDCSGVGMNDGTVFTASMMNVLLANLRYAVRQAGVTLADTDDTMLWNAMLGAATGGVAMTISTI